MPAKQEWIKNRVNLPTAKGSGEISRDIPAQIRARAFFSARVAEAHILDRFRSITDDYLSGRIGRDEARALLREYARASGKDDGTESLKNLASTARLELILDQNAKMARAVYRHERMYSPAALRVFPYVRYRASVGSRQPRSEHGKYDGMIFRKDDPWLRTHTPPWDFGCNCELEQITEKQAAKLGGPVSPTPPERVKVDSRNGFSFDPAHAFETEDLTGMQPASRASIVRQAEEAVRDQRLGPVGMIVAPPAQGLPPAELPKLDEVRTGFDAMKETARRELENAGLDPDHLPNYLTVNQAVRDSGKVPENITGAVRDRFPAEPIKVGTLNSRAAEAAGIPQLPVLLERGNSRYGIEHLWRNHKELFAVPENAVRLLRETLGNPNCRVVVSMKRAAVTSHVAGREEKQPICLKRIVLHNPTTGGYCVMVQSGEQLRLVSWHNAGEDYGDSEWRLE